MLESGEGRPPCPPTPCIEEAGTAGTRCTWGGSAARLWVGVRPRAQPSADFGYGPLQDVSGPGLRLELQQWGCEQREAVFWAFPPRFLRWTWDGAAAVRTRLPAEEDGLPVQRESPRLLGSRAPHVPPCVLSLWLWRSFHHGEYRPDSFLFSSRTNFKCFCSDTWAPVFCPRQSVADVNQSSGDGTSRCVCVWLFTSCTDSSLSCTDTWSSRPDTVRWESPQSWPFTL